MGTEREILRWQNQYNTAMSWAKMKPAGSKAQAQEYFKAAQAQHELMKLTEGEAAKRHKLEVDRLTDMVYAILNPDPEPTPKAAAKPAAKAKSGEQKKTNPPTPPSGAGTAGTGKKGKELKRLYTKEQLRGIDIDNARYEDPDDMKASFDDLKGTNKQLVIEHFQKVHALEAYANLPTRADGFSVIEQNLNLFLYGPAGTGKSTYISAMCRFILTNEPDAVAFILTPDLFRADLQGIAEKVIAEVFYEARQFRNAIICVDEIDSLCPKDTGHGDRGVDTLKTFLNEVDGIRKQDGNVTVVAATNYPWKVDAAAVSRLPNRIYIGLPDADELYDFILSHARPFIGGTPAEQEAMARYIAGRLEHASYREARQVAGALYNRSFLKTVRLNPDNPSVDTYAPLTREEIDEEVLKGIVILYNPALIEAYAHPERW